MISLLVNTNQAIRKASIFLGFTRKNLPKGLTTWLNITTTAETVFLYLHKTPVPTSKLFEQLFSINKAMCCLIVQNMRHSHNELTGTKGSNHTAINWVATTPGATAIRVVGDGANET